MQLRICTKKFEELQLTLTMEKSFTICEINSLGPSLNLLRATDGSLFTLRILEGFEFNVGDSFRCRVTDNEDKNIHPLARLLYRGIVDCKDPHLISAYGYDVRFTDWEFIADSNIRIEFILQ